MLAYFNSKLIWLFVQDLVKKNEDIFVSTKAQQTFWECKLRPILLTGDEVCGKGL